MALFVMWTGVFAALKKDEFIGRFIEPIKSQGEALGQVALKLPLSAPIIPAPRGPDGQQRNASVLNVLDHLSPRQLNQQLDFRRHENPLNPRPGGNRTEKRIKELTEAIRAHNGNQEITNNINLLANANATPQQRGGAVRAIEQELNARGVRVDARERQQVFEALARARGMTPAQRKQMFDNLANSAP